MESQACCIHLKNLAKLFFSMQGFYYFFPTLAELINKIIVPYPLKMSELRNLLAL